VSRQRFDLLSFLYFMPAGVCGGGDRRAPPAIAFKGLTSQPEQLLSHTIDCNAIAWRQMLAAVFRLAIHLLCT
jgi:hypothetical protein